MRYLQDVIYDDEHDLQVRAHFLSHFDQISHGETPTPCRSLHCDAALESSNQCHSSALNVTFPSANRVRRWNQLMCVESKHRYCMYTMYSVRISLK